VQAAVYLAERPDEAPVRAGEIAEALDVPRNYLSKILHRLAGAGILASERGPHGGFRLAAEPGSVSLARIVEAVESRPGDRRCLLGRPECSDADPCAVHDRWLGLADRIDAFVQGTTLAQLSRAGGAPARRRRSGRPRTRSRRKT
jgi:Rrf2 family iron-sulfur cluster assembly transcriptional regulator